MPEPLSSPIASIAIVAALLLLGAVDLRGTLSGYTEFFRAEWEPVVLSLGFDPTAQVLVLASSRAAGETSVCAPR
jgi:hypothetical protein